MRKNILIPTDFSKNAWNATIYATSLFRNTECNFYLLNAFQMYHITTESLLEPEPGDEIYEQERESSQRGLEELVDGLHNRQDHNNHHFKMISVYNTVTDAVKESVKKLDISLIVMGTRGETDTNNFLYGSNAIDVMDKVKDIPVLVVPDYSSLPEGVLREIVFATNFKSSFKKQELEQLLDIARSYKVVTRFLYVADNDTLSKEQEKNKAELELFFGDLPHSFHTLKSKKVVGGIQAFIESRSSDLLVIYNRKHGFLTDFFSKSIVKEIGHKPLIPMLVLKEIE